MDPLDQTSNGSNNATNNIPEPVVGQNLFPAGSIQTPMVSATNTMPPPVSGSVATDSALHASQSQPLQILHQHRQLLRRQHRK